jgi:hypothetical protein
VPVLADEVVGEVTPLVLETAVLDVAVVVRTVAPAGMTRVWPGWMTLEACNEFARSSADNRTPCRQARPASESPERTVIVVSTVVVVLCDGAAVATPPETGRRTVSETPVARMIRAVRFTAGPSARPQRTLTPS